MPGIPEENMGDKEDFLQIVKGMYSDELISDYLKFGIIVYRSNHMPHALNTTGP